MLRLCERSDRFSNFKSESSDLIGRSTNISKQLHGWLESLNNTDIKGVKFYTNKERERRERDREFEEFDREMARYKAEIEARSNEQRS